MINITAMTTICADIFEDSGEILLGGEALNFAMAISSSYPDINISLMGAVGNDEIGRKAIECIRNSSIDMSCVHVIDGGKTASNRIYHDAGGDRYFKEDSWDGGVYQDFTLSEIDRAKLRETNVVFINYSCPNFVEILALKSEYGYKLAVDFDVAANYDEIGNIVGSIEFNFFSGNDDMLPIIEEWSKLYEGIFNATLAERGSISYHKGEEYRVKAVPVEKIVDTTGCGDNYHAAFLASYVMNRNNADTDKPTTMYDNANTAHTILSAMNAGSLQASRTLTHVGGF
ncbi:MAG: PfkB family carbohydrate kinase [Butyrivibrio sp.]|nr:PfkB family carbohydrate kinase [Butyrivibrio sp.]